MTSILSRVIGRFLWPMVILNLFFGSVFGGDELAYEKDKLAEISRSRTWSLLLGYTDSGQSEIVTDNFFLAAEGDHDPYAELLATLSAFSKPVGDPDKHAQCRYRARFIFLNRILHQQNYGVTPITCPSFESFQYQDQLTGIKLVFASGYFGNPASYYGHLLLKLETDEHGITDLEQTAINFGAIYPPDENMPTYIFKGVFGGYDAIFKQHQYYRQSLNYGETDLRDVWEYELNLTDDEVSLLAAHLWEIQGFKYKYFFFDRNCSFRMAKAIELVLDNSLVNDSSIWQIPQHLIQQLSITNHHGKPLIKSVRYLPSRQSRLYLRYLNLTELEKITLRKLIDNTELLEGYEFNEIAIESKYRLLDILLDYYQYLLIKEYEDRAMAKRQYQLVLSKRFSLPPGVSPVYFSADSSPDEGRKPSYFQLGMVRKDHNMEMSMKIRPAYYDGLDYDSGHIKNSSLSMGELDLETAENELMIKSIGIVKIESIQRNITGLPGDQVYSWYVNSGFISNIERCEDCLDLAINSGIGLTNSSFNDKVIISAFIGGGFFGNSLTEEAFHSTARLLLNVSVSPTIRFQIEARNDYFKKKERDKEIHLFEGRKELTQNSDFRIKIEEDGDVKYSIAAGLYW